MTSSLKNHLIILSILTAVIAIVYSNALGGTFVFDDYAAIVTNRDLIVPETSWKRMWTSDFWGQEITSPGSHKSYRPLVILTFRINRIISAWRLNISEAAPPPRAPTLKVATTNYALAPDFHFVNVVMFVFLCYLIYYFGLILFGTENLIPTITGSILFAIHPIHTEAVTGIVGRAELMCCMFSLFSFFSFNHGSKQSKTNWFWVTLSLICLICATLCKETGLTISAVLVIYDILFISEHHKTLFKLPSKNLLLRAFSVIVTCFGFLIARIYINGEFGNPQVRFLENPIAFAAGKRFWLSLAMLHTKYLQLLVYPINMSADWSYNCLPLIETFSDPRNLFSLLAFSVLVFIILYCLITFNKKSLILLVWFFATALPATNLLFPVGTMIGERLLFMPSLGFCFIIGQFISYLYNKANQKTIWKSTIIIMLFMCSCIIYGRKTLQRNPFWDTNEGLFEDALRVCPNSAKVLFILGKQRQYHRDWNQSYYYLQEAQKVLPEYCDVNFNAGYALVKMFDMGNGMPLIVKGLDCPSSHNEALSFLNKVYMELIKADSTNITTLNDWGNIMIHEKEYAEAGSSFLAAAKILWENATTKSSALDYARKACKYAENSCETRLWCGYMLLNSSFILESIPHLTAASYKHNCSNVHLNALDQLIGAYKTLYEKDKRYELVFQSTITRAREVMMEANKKPII